MAKNSSTTNPKQPAVSINGTGTAVLDQPSIDTTLNGKASDSTSRQDDESLPESSHPKTERVEIIP